MCNITVSSLAKHYAESLEKNGNEVRAARLEFDFKAICFNYATIATIATISAAIFSSSAWLLVLSFVCYQTRLSFLKAVELTGINLPNQRMEIGDDLLGRIANLDPVRREREIAQTLGIEREDWELYQYRFLDFKLWIHLTSLEPLPAMRQGIAPGGPA